VVLVLIWAVAVAATEMLLGRPGLGGISETQSLGG